MKHELLLLVPVIGLMFAPAFILASGPRFDYLDDWTQQEISCYRDGYESGFAHVYYENRAKECEDHKDQYNIMWIYACKYSGQTEIDCNKFKDEPTNEKINVDQLADQNTKGCYNDGYKDGLDHPFNQTRNKGCYDYGSQYYHGFIDGCTAVAGNTKDVCERFTDA